ncbi:MAG: hypothetical protein QNI87_03500 [Erythrobacter sp.]|uniref:hypothetical protein n=1 Tax=Erythrobacter sp. TaxID=1042 RepID=UPI00260E7FE9|nr:hypothetical protein [Erythrobacter sp.]MDJ0977578.1 hypothetical protein [Erythrobacter sp.]
MATGDKSRISPFWLIVIMLLFVIGAIVLFSDVFLGERAPEREPEQPTDEWTTAPEDGVKVDLPEAPLRIVPRDEETEEDKPEGERR